ncbi:MAG: TonB-dependent receptor [Acidobacteria bacterium]|nr:TonB-dependent receptor [Acidobacteriota bacterium]
MRFIPRAGSFTFALLLCHAFALGQTSIQGVVRDQSGALVSGATVQWITTHAGSGISAILHQGRTTTNGEFRLPHEPSARLRITAAGFAEREIRQPFPLPLEVILTPDSVYNSITVSATPTTRGVAEEALDSSHIVTIKTARELSSLPMPTLGQALAGEPGVLLQQSTYAQASPFLRGLTGYQVLNLVDGIRFNNSTFRSGPNQYLAYIEPSQAQRIEAVLGPAGVSWGSDSLGGTIHVLTAQPSFASERGRPELHGQFQLSATSADLSAAASGHIAASTPRFYWLGGLSGRRHNDLRAGDGYDSRNVFLRLFGMQPAAVRELTGNRQQDSGFRQYGAEARFAARLRPDQMLTFNYQRGAQDKVNGYKDLLGGLGRLISTFEPQDLNWLYARYEKLRLSWLDSINTTFSFNSQTDGGRRQNLSYADPITTDYTRVNVYGYNAQATTHYGSRMLASFGGDLYDEHIRATREIRNPVSSVVTNPRPLYPDNSRYQNLGAFAQGSYQILRSLRAAAGVRLTGVRFATTEDRALRIPSSSQWFRDVTFQSSVSWQITGAFGIHGVISRGFRAPNLNDLGALGLNDLGYEIPAAETISAGALLSTDAGESALSKGRALSRLSAESLMNYEFGTRVRTRRFYARAQLFDAELYDPIVRRTVLFPVNGVPASLAGLSVTPIAQTAAQRQQGVVTVATAIDPRAVKAFVNDGQSRYYGVETLGRAQVLRHLALEANYSYILGRDLFPNRNIRRLPPAIGTMRLRYSPAGRKPWIELSVTASAEQSRLSGGDRDDERIGASFRRADIASFFAGSRVAALTDPVTRSFRPTGETLLQIQNRVLPIGATINGVRVTDDNSRVPLYLSNAGWTVLGLRTGIPLGERFQIAAAIENILDRNYRYHGSGIDAPGFNTWVGIKIVY